jgi:quercetin dioxygenase-like cupin family protein
MVKALVRRLADQPWEHWPAEQMATRGTVAWKNLFGDDPGAGADLTLGVARLRKGETLEPHRHAQPETYFGLSGRGVVTVEGEAHLVEPGTAIFIPGGAEHHIRNDEEAEFRLLYTFAVQDFGAVVYRF